MKGYASAVVQFRDGSLDAFEVTEASHLRTIANRPEVCHVSVFRISPEGSPSLPKELRQC